MTTSDEAAVCVVCGDEAAVWLADGGYFCGEHDPYRCDDLDHIALRVENQRLLARCGECGEMTRSADPFGNCPACAAAIGDDGSYTLEGAINEVLFPLARERLHRELAALHARCEQAEATVARLGAAALDVLDDRAVFGPDDPSEATLRAVLSTLPAPPAATVNDPGEVRP